MNINMLLPLGLVAKRTRFKAFTLKTAGASFSYFDGEHFTLIEGRVPENNVIEDEMTICGVSSIDTLHITSWDQDHCSYAELEHILEKYKPNKVEAPGYSPHSDSGEKCKALIETYRNSKSKPKVNFITPEYIKSLDKGRTLKYTNILFHPKTIWQEDNDNSTIKLFRSGMFNVLSLGDVEHAEIGAMLKSTSFRREVDVLILPHHGAKSDLLTKDFLEKLAPSVIICSSNHGNQYDHPRQYVRNIASELEIPLYTTKSSEVVIESINAHVADYSVTQTQANGVEDLETFRSKKFVALNKPKDNLKKSFHFSKR